jgi:hypothetical protein
MSDIKVEMGEFPVAYVRQLKYNSRRDTRELEALKIDFDILRETCWCILSSITDEDDRKFLRDTLKGEK